MTEQDLLKAITESPNDDTPKLIYADWLDEQGDPRGQLLRLSVEMSRLQGEVSPEWKEQLGIQVEREVYRKSVFGVYFETVSVDVPRLQTLYHYPNINAGDLIRATHTIIFDTYGIGTDVKKTGEALRRNCAYST